MEIVAAKDKSSNRNDLKVNNAKPDLTKSEVEAKPYSIALRLKTTLYDTLANYLAAMHNVSDYRFGSISDILRYILLKLEQEGFQNEVIEDEGAEYKQSAIKVTQQQKLFWQQLPAHNRRKILEKGVIAFIKGKL
jgi:hypothetical protein